ncbi:MAG: glycosyltransferase [Kiritimatiellia bacterium]
MTPRVSICLPNLNSVSFLEERIRSLVAQSLQDWELVVCDSGSDDGSWEFLQQFAQDPRVRLYSVPRAGLYAGWNECLRRVTGEYVYIAPSDDTCAPTLLERLSTALDRHPAVDLAVCRYNRIDQHGKALPDLESPDVARFLGVWYRQPHMRDGLAELIISLCLGCQWNTMPAVLFRRRLLARAGLFSTEHLSYADAAWRVKALLHSDVIYIPERLASWRWHPQQATARTPANRHELVYRLLRKSLYEEENLIPATWRTSRDWIDRLLLWVRQEYLMQFHLNRTALKRTPRAFLLGFLRASLKEPRYMLRRLRTGFSWDEPEYGDPVNYVEALISRWQVPWPPIPVNLV